MVYCKSDLDLYSCLPCIMHFVKMTTTNITSLYKQLHIQAYCLIYNNYKKYKS